jgi:hypothetical protein
MMNSTSNLLQAKMGSTHRTLKKQKDSMQNGCTMSQFWRGNKEMIDEMYCHYFHSMDNGNASRVEEIKLPADGCGWGVSMYDEL